MDFSCATYSIISLVSSIILTYLSEFDSLTLEENNIFFKIPHSFLNHLFNKQVLSRVSTPVVDRIMVPRDIQILIQEPINMLPYITKGILHICLRTLRWTDYPVLSRWAQCKHPYT